jgi:hypothetical protein
MRHGFAPAWLATASGGACRDRTACVSDTAISCRSAAHRTAAQCERGLLVLSLKGCQLRLELIGGLEAANLITKLLSAPLSARDVVVATDEPDVMNTEGVHLVE